jgi:hypothetical protein
MLNREIFLHEISLLPTAPPITYQDLSQGALLIGFFSEEKDFPLFAKCVILLSALRRWFY